MTISNLMKMTESSPKQVENTVGKGEIAMSNFSLSYSVFKRLVLQTCKNQSLFGKGLIVNLSMNAYQTLWQKENHLQAIYLLPIMCLKVILCKMEKAFH